MYAYEDDDTKSKWHGKYIHPLAKLNVNIKHSV